MSRAKRKDEKLDLIFHALSDYRRRQVLAKLSQGPRIIRELGADFEMSKPAVGRHIKMLERAGLLKRKEDGRVHRCELRPETLKRVEDWLNFYR